MRKQIIKLSDALLKEDFMKSIRDKEKKMWQLVIDELDSSYEPDFVLPNKLILGLVSLEDKAKELSAYSKNEIVGAFSESKKTSSAWSLGGKLLNLIPVAGLAFSFVMSCKDIYWALIELDNIILVHTNNKLSFEDIMWAPALKQKVIQARTPKETVAIVRAAKAGRDFADQLISLCTADGLDLVKDLIFLIPNATGFTIFLDIALSAALWAIEWKLESNALNAYDQVFDEARKKASLFL
jgi:hypothetical protein